MRGSSAEDREDNDTRPMVPSIDTGAIVVSRCGTVSRHSKTLEQIRALNGGLHWSKVEALFRSYRAEVHEGGGSTVTFVIDGLKFTMDRPHPRRECGKGLVKRVREYLRKCGRLQGHEVKR